MIEKSIKWHFLFWIVLVFIGVATLSIYYQSLFKATMHRIIFLPAWWIASYFNILYIMPRLWDKGKRILNLVVIALIILGLTIIMRYACVWYIYPKYFWMVAPNENELDPFWIQPFIQFYFFITLPVILTMFIREGMKWYRENYQARQLIEQQQTAELDYLKNQINPHFLFNTLNNLYGLSLESSKKVPAMILKLSDILSYSLYESQIDRISISKEVQLIQQFIGLEMERYGDRMHIDFKISDSVDQQNEIAPLLLIPLVENAFKHGVKEATDRVEIKISLTCSNGWFNFTIINDIPFSEESKESKKSGIGLYNLKRRLSLLYPGEHELMIKNSGQKFIAELKIHIDA